MNKRAIIISSDSNDSDAERPSTSCNDDSRAKRENAMSSQQSRLAKNLEASKKARKDKREKRCKDGAQAFILDEAKEERQVKSKEEKKTKQHTAQSIAPPPSMNSDPVDGRTTPTKTDSSSPSSEALRKRLQSDFERAHKEAKRPRKVLKSRKRLNFDV